MRTLLLVALAAWLSACDPKPDSAPNAAAEHNVSGEWLEADGPGETALVFHAPGAEDIAMTCAQASKTLAVSVAAPAGADATIFFGAKGFQSELTPADEAGRSELVMPVNAEILQAVTDATSLRVTVGDTFFETGQDRSGKFKAFAATCAMLSMPKRQ